MEIKYKDEIVHRKGIGKVRIRHLEKLPPKLEVLIDKLEILDKFVDAFKERRFEEAVKLLMLLLPVDEIGIEEIRRCKNDLEIIQLLEEVYKKLCSKLSKEVDTEETEVFLKTVTENRYPSYFTLNHAGDAEPEAVIEGGVFVCSYSNVFWNGRKKLYVFGPRNRKFKEYLRKIREKAEEIEGKEFFEGLPLKATREGIEEYVKRSKNAFISVLLPKDREDALRKYNTDFLIAPMVPSGMTRINGRAKFSSVDEAVAKCFYSTIEKIKKNMSEEERKAKLKIVAFSSKNVFKGEWYGKDNVEILTVLYSELPYGGLREWGGRIEITPNDVTPELYVDFWKEGIKYRFCDLAELMIDLRKREVIFFDVE